MHFIGVCEHETFTLYYANCLRSDHTHTCLRVQHRAYEINQQRQISLWYMQDRETPAWKKIYTNQSKSLSGDACTTIRKAEHIPHENALLPHHKSLGPFHRNCECEAQLSTRKRLYVIEFCTAVVLWLIAGGSCRSRRKIHTSRYYCCCWFRFIYQT